MDRLEEIKRDMKAHEKYYLNENDPDLTRHILWLISEIERLEKVIKKALETVVHCSIDPAAIATRNILQQALKGE